MQVLDSEVHIFLIHELDYTSSISENIGITDVSGFPHVILDILPTASSWQP